MFQKILLLLLVLTSLQTFSQQEEINIISWNIQDFGKTKSNDELNEMAELLRDGYFGSFCARHFGLICATFGYQRNPFREVSKKPNPCYF